MVTDTENLNVYKFVEVLPRKFDPCPFLGLLRSNASVRLRLAHFGHVFYDVFSDVLKRLGHAPFHIGAGHTDDHKAFP